MESDDEDYGDTDIGCSSISIPSYHTGMGSRFIDLAAKKEESVAQNEQSTEQQNEAST